MAAGDRHTCAALDDESLFCWGAGESGQLGRGHADSLVPLKASDHFATRNVIAGSRHTCAMDGKGIACWGNNDRGQLGHAGSGALDETDELYVKPPPGVAAGDFVVQGWSARGDHSCMVTAKGQIYCWGSNEHSELGIAPSPFSQTAVLVVTSEFTPPVSLSWLEVAVGESHACAGNDLFSVACWGDNESGQLGLMGPPDGPGIDALQAIYGRIGGSIIAVGAGNSFTCAATWVTQVGDDAVICWGANDLGQLGNGSNVSSARGVRVALPPGAVSKLSVGESHACAIDGAFGMRCWGSNAHGQLGNGMNIDSNIPVYVLGDLRFRDVIAGKNHTCGITTDGAAYCWGANESGQLGNGTTIDSAIPVGVKTLS
jgi:alpha-tubulin suppressor-like RCC1 family protein